MDYQEYQKKRHEIIEIIKSTHRWQEHEEGFIADGIINFHEFDKQKVKVLVVLAESYGYHEMEMVDIEEQNNNDILGLMNYTVQSPRKIASLLWLLFNSLDSGKKIPYDSMPRLFTVGNYYNELNSVLKRIAWINIKKASKDTDSEETTRLNYNEIVQSGNRNKAIIIEQINLINPNLIIACGNAVIDALMENNILGEKIKSKEKWRLHNNELGQKMLFTSHPSYVTDWGYEGVYETYEILHKGLNLGLINKSSL